MRSELTAAAAFRSKGAITPSWFRRRPTEASRDALSRHACSHRSSASGRPENSKNDPFRLSLQKILGNTIFFQRPKVPWELSSRRSGA